VAGFLNVTVDAPPKSRAERTERESDEASVRVREKEERRRSSQTARSRAGVAYRCHQSVAGHAPLRSQRTETEMSLSAVRSTGTACLFRAWFVSPAQDDRETMRPTIALNLQQRLNRSDELGRGCWLLHKRAVRTVAFDVAEPRVDYERNAALFEARAQSAAVAVTQCVIENSSG